jgi:hypothetical protein
MFEISYYKPKNRGFLDNLESLGINNPQNYIPIYKSFFELNESNYNNISFNHRIHITAIDTLFDTKAPTQEICDANYFIKYSPILDPINYMIGKYNIQDPRLQNLPQYNSTTETCLEKVLNTNNSSYIDGFFTFLTSQLLHHHKFIHGVDYYGSFLGTQREFKINVIEELEHLDGADFFHKQKNKLFVVDNPFENPFYCDNSRNCKTRLIMTDEPIELDDIEVLGIVRTAAPTPPLPTELSFSPPSETFIEAAAPPAALPTTENIINDILPVDVDGDKDGIATSVSSNDSSLNYTDNEENNDDDDVGDTNSCESGEEETVSSSDNSLDNTEIWATIYNFPVHLICMEKCTGTLDELMMQNLTENEWRGALFQVIMILLVYQKVFYLTHNDLHTNNIMWITTAEKFIYYKFNQKYYKVPTYGRIFKIIDYGRAIYTFAGKLFCSDSFDFHGDAATQYNFPPYYNEKKPLIEPNYSFDLCRLGCSIYDFVFKHENDEPTTDFERLILEWCTDDNGKNIMYKKNGQERYMDFKLYKMIARNVHAHTPAAQLERAFFAIYKTKTPSATPALLVNIDILGNANGVSSV